MRCDTYQRAQIASCETAINANQAYESNTLRTVDEAKISLIPGVCDGAGFVSRTGASSGSLIPVSSAIRRSASARNKLGWRGFFLLSSDCAAYQSEKCPEVSLLSIRIICEEYEDLPLPGKRTPLPRKPTSRYNPAMPSVQSVHLCPSKDQTHMRRSGAHTSKQLNTAKDTETL